MKTSDKLTERQRRNMQFSEDRIDLLDTIRDMIDDLDALPAGVYIVNGKKVIKD